MTIITAVISIARRNIINHDLAVILVIDAISCYGLAVTAFTTVMLHYRFWCWLRTNYGMAVILVTVVMVFLVFFWVEI